MNIKIEKWYNSDIVLETEEVSLKIAVEKAVANSANLSGADLSDADFFQTKFYGRGGKTTIKKSQTENFFTALGILAKD